MLSLLAIAYIVYVFDKIENAKKARDQLNQCDYI